MPREDTQFSSKRQPKKNGRTKGTKDIKDIIKIFLEQEIAFEDIKGKPKRMKVIDAMVLKQLKKAYEDGDIASYKEMVDRTYGKIKDELNVSGDITVNKVMFSKGKNGK